LYLGRSGTNFTDSSQRQILVRADADRVKSALSRLEFELADRNVTVIKGRSKLKGISHLLSEPEAHRPALSNESEPKGRRGDRPGATDELLRFFGLDREWLRRLVETKPKPDIATAVDGEVAGPPSESAANRPTAIEEREPVADASAAPVESEVKAEEPSLVARRLRDLKDQSADADHRLITLVIELSLAAPGEAPPGSDSPSVSGDDPGPSKEGPSGGPKPGGHKSISPKPGPPNNQRQ
jgi:hypothetical protein